MCYTVYRSGPFDYDGVVFDSSDEAWSSGGSGKSWGDSMSGATLPKYLEIAGAIVTHLTSLGVQVIDPQTGEGDGGLLFGLALAVAFGSLVVLAYRWRQLPLVTRFLTRG